MRKIAAQRITAVVISDAVSLRKRAGLG